MVLWSYHNSIMRVKKKWFQGLKDILRKEFVKTQSKAEEKNLGVLSNVRLFTGYDDALMLSNPI